MTLLRKLKVRLGLVFRSLRWVVYEDEGKQYLAVIRTCWHGTKWSKHFEIAAIVENRGLNEPTSRRDLEEWNRLNILSIPSVHRPDIPVSTDTVVKTDTEDYLKPLAELKEIVNDTERFCSICEKWAFTVIGSVTTAFIFFIVTTTCYLLGLC